MAIKTTPTGCPACGKGFSDRRIGTLCDCGQAVLEDESRYAKEPTPGPWEVDSGMVQTVRELPSSGLHIPIAYMDREPSNGTMPVERDANARLIAAAPDLLEALRSLQQEILLVTRKVGS